MRKSIPILLKDGNEYLFTERNREDSDLFFLQEKLRKYYYSQIQESITDKDILLSQLLFNQKREFTGKELAIFISSNKELRLLTCFESFKVNNPAIPLELFKKLIDEDMIPKVYKLISELEETNESDLEDSLNDFIQENRDLSFLEFMTLINESSIDVKGFAKIVKPLFKKKELKME